MTEDLEQLLKNLKLRRILEIYDEQVHAAEKDDISYSDFVTRLVRAQYQARQEGALEWRIGRANLPERWSLETFPFARQPGGEYRPDRQNRGGQDRNCLWPAAESAGERSPRAIHPGAGPVR